MDVVRARVGSAVEWVVAAVFLLATLAVGSLVLRELRAAIHRLPAGRRLLRADVPPAGASSRLART